MSDVVPLTPQEAGERLSAAPDLAVIVVTPNDRECDLALRAQDLLKRGSRLVWVLNSRARMAKIYRPHGPGTILRENHELSGEDVLPGFRCRVADLFQPPLAADQYLESSAQEQP
jgi:Uma2 family endonuclease